MFRTTVLPHSMLCFARLFFLNSSSARLFFHSDRHPHPANDCSSTVLPGLGLVLGLYIELGLCLGIALGLGLDLDLDLGLSLGLGQSLGLGLGLVLGLCL